jgi:hypothetical protein
LAALRAGEAWRSEVSVLHQWRQTRFSLPQICSALRPPVTLGTRLRCYEVCPATARPSIQSPVQKRTSLPRPGNCSANTTELPAASLQNVLSKRGTPCGATQSSEDSTLTLGIVCLLSEPKRRPPGHVAMQLSLRASRELSLWVTRLS